LPSSLQSQPQGELHQNLERYKKRQARNVSADKHSSIRDRLEHTAWTNVHRVLLPPSPSLSLPKSPLLPSELGAAPSEPGGTKYFPALKPASQCFLRLFCSADLPTAKGCCALPLREPASPPPFRFQNVGAGAPRTPSPHRWLPSAGTTKQLPALPPDHPGVALFLILQGEG